MSNQVILGFGHHLEKLDNLPVLVLGNGESRKKIRLNFFKQTYTIVGCNAVYRDIKVDHLVCCDRRMVKEAVAVNTDSKIYTRRDWIDFYSNYTNILTVPELHYSGSLKQDQPIHWGSGSYAVLLAANFDSLEINLLGFDLYGKNNFVNNCYKDTVNYSKKYSPAIDPSFWIHQIAKVFEHFETKNFTVINKSNWVMPKEWQKSNVNFKTIDDFLVDNKYRCSTIVP